MHLSHGYSRTVLLTRRWALKLPRVTGGWRNTLCGMLSNMAEAERWKHARDPGLCPVLWSLPGGLLLVMPRVKPADETPARNLAGHDHKPSSYGYHRGELVAIDYHGDVYREAA